MDLYLHPNGNYYVRYSRGEKPPHGGLKSFRSLLGYSIRDKKKAKAALELLQDDWHQKRLHELDRSKPVSIEAFKNIYTTCDERKDLSPDTLRADCTALDALAGITSKSKAIRAITKNDLGKLKTVLLARGRSPFTVKSYFAHIRSAINWAIENGYRERPIKMPRLSLEKLLPKPIPTADLDDILAVAMVNKPEAYRYFVFSLWTGCRLTECITFAHQRISWFDKPKGHLVARARVIGKGRKERPIPLLAEAAEAVGEPKDLGPVFTQVHPNTVSHWFGKIVKCCGYEDRGYHFHSLRHTAATRMVEKGYPLRVVQKILGHVDIRTTQNYADAVDLFIESEMAKRG